MKHLDEYRDSEITRKYLDMIKVKVSGQWTIMEVCGGQTHAILKYGIDRLLPDKINILHGPGCPVCVTPVNLIDRAIEIALRPDTILCSFGDMLRVPGSERNLFSARAEGGKVQAVYSPLDALALARQNREKEVVFFAIGFETTAPANAAVVHQAMAEGMDNFSILSAQVLVPPAIEVILDNTANKVNGFLAAGHVCTITGFADYERLCKEYGVPFVISGFEPLDIIQGIYILADLLENGAAKVENQYSRVVRREGNIEAQKMMSEVFRVVDREWRGMGLIPKSGLALNEKYWKYDAERKLDLEERRGHENNICISGEILQGLKKPFDCSKFSNECTPEHPLGATMVSSEGACAAYYRYSRQEFRTLR